MKVETDTNYSTMPTFERSEIMAQLTTGFSYPKRSDVEDNTCYIC